MPQNVTIPKPLTSGATDFPNAPQSGASDDLPAGYSRTPQTPADDLPPGYSREAAPKPPTATPPTSTLGYMSKMPGAPAQQSVKAPDDSVNGAITSALSYASQIPGALGNMIRSSWMDKPQQGKPTAGEQIVSGLNPANAVVNNRPGDPNSGVDWGATGVNTIGQVLGAHEMAPTIEDAISDIHPLNTIKGAAKSAANSANIGLEPHEAITKGLRPSVKDAPQLQKSLPIAAPEIARQHAVTPIDGAQGLADAAHTGANDIYTKEIEPQINRNPNEMINERLPESKAEGMPTAPAQGTIGDSIRAKINPGMERMFPDQARKARAVADMLDRPMTLREASENLKALNAETEGFWKMSPEGRAAVGVTDGLMSAYEDGAAGLREKMAAKLTSLGEVDPGNYRRQYGALKDVQRVAQKRATVVGNQAALNLPQQLTTALGLGEAGGALLSGHPAAAAGGVVAAATPHLLRYLNSTERLIRSGVGGLEAPAAEAFGLRPPPGHMPGAAQGVLPLTPGEHGFNLEPPPGQTPPAPAQQYGLPGIGRSGLDLNVPPQPTVAPSGPTQLPASPLENMKRLAAAPGEGRTTMSATEFTDALKNNRSMRTPFDYTEGARQTANDLGSEAAQRGRAAEIAKKYPVQSINPIRDPFAAPARTAEAPVSHNMITDAEGKPDRLEIMKGDQPLGHLKIEEQIPGTWTVKDATVNQPGKGYGSGAYKQLISEAQKAGIKTIESDISNTSNASGVWKSLQREFPKAVTEENGQYSMDVTRLKK